MATTNFQTKLLIVSGAIALFTFSCQKSAETQNELKEPQTQITTPQIEPLPNQIEQAAENQQRAQPGSSVENKCEPPRWRRGGFIFTGQVKEILPYQKRECVESTAGCYEPEAGFEPQNTVRFTIEKIYRGHRKDDNNVKEVMVDVIESRIKSVSSLKVGESYLVYATPRYYGNGDYSLKDNLIAYPDESTKPISQSKEAIDFLENSQSQTLREDLGINPTEFIVSGGLMQQPRNLVQPEYPKKAKAAKASGKVNVRIFVNEKGKVINATATSGKNELLRKASVDAALKSAFTPVMICGKPFKATGVIVYNFVAQ